MARTRGTVVAAAVAAAVTLVACNPGPASPGGTAGPPTTPTGTSAPGSPAATASTDPSASGSAPASPTASPTPTPDPSCVEGLTLADQVGQLFVMGVAATGASSGQLALIGETRVGAVILMGNTSAPISGVREVTDAVREAARQPGGVEVMVAVDQEGGLVRRLQGPDFAPMPSAVVQSGWSDGELTRQATRWGRDLAAAGVDADFAPVADVVPAEVGERNQPVAAVDRGYGSDPAMVGRKVSAFIAGMHAGEVAVSVKHFPGLGRVIGNTDFVSKVVDETTARDDPLLAGFDAGQAAGADMIMVSTAYYTKIDPDRPAAFSPEVIGGMLRQDRDFDGVVVSDDLGVAKAVTGLDPGERALRFLRAGGDLAINVDPATTDDMIDAVLSEAEADPRFAARISESAERVLRLKSRYGLADCH